MRRCCFFGEASPETSGSSPPAPIPAYPPGGGSDRSKTPRPGLMAVGDSGDGKSQLPAPAEKRLFRVVVRMGEGGGVEFDSNQAYQKNLDERTVHRGFCHLWFFYKKKGERKSVFFLTKECGQSRRIMVE